MMQTLGTEWGRGLVDQDIWVKAAMAEAGRIRLRENKPVVIDDLRFPNELKAIKRAWGGFWYISRPSVVPPDGPTHASEGKLEATMPDYTIENDGSIDLLVSRVSWAFEMEDYWNPVK